MAALFVQSLTIYDNENLHDSIKSCQSVFKILLKTKSTLKKWMVCWYTSSRLISQLSSFATYSKVKKVIHSSCSRDNIKALVFGSRLLSKEIFTAVLPTEDFTT